MHKQKSIKLSFSSAFQMKYCMVILTVFVAANFLLYLLMDKALSGSYLENLRTLNYLDQNLPLYLSIMAFLQILFILLLSLIITLLVSHQIAGPIFRYEEILSQISAGQFPEQVATRNSDQLKPMVDSLNELTTSFRGVYRSAQMLEKLASSAEVDSKQLQQQINQVREKMGVFSSGGGNQ